MTNHQLNAFNYVAVELLPVRMGVTGFAVLQPIGLCEYFVRNVGLICFSWWSDNCVWNI